MPTFLLLLLLLLLTLTTACSGRHVTPAAADGPSALVASACSRARFPGPCVRALAHASPRTPTDLAVASVAASLSSARSAASALRSAAPSPLPGPLRDCLQQLSDSADQLERTRAELSRLQRPRAARAHGGMQLDNACTWVSAALTNEDTCLDAAKGLPAGPLRDAVTARVRALEKETSNALYFVTHLDGDDTPGQL
ncbi:putative basic proline-rich protein-like [Iris pallida]|uniref:Basic proline-rich protein-like n=1 Tax=Iris pallida TaxID=29817 RepID=A0AAX6FWX1_IRIPA|nr:putative basic proline-rich protein-like [Iris pallida]KAJ6820566.1 putative basic proline-rich protein-like [Iris pallida]